MTTTLEGMSRDTTGLDDSVMCELRIKLLSAVEANHCDRRLLMLNPCYNGCKYGIICPNHPQYTPLN